jgi:type 1 glutamine amidotransferase
MRWMMKLCVAVALVTVLGTATARADDKPVRALFVLVGAGGHNVEVNTPPLFQTIDKVGGIKATLLAPPRGKPGDGAHLSKLGEVKKADYDVLVFYTVGNKLTEEQEKALEKFLDEGGGIVAIHGATASFSNSKLWLNLTGGRFAGHAPGTYDLLINITDTKHPITAGVEPFTINDEEYTYRFAEGVQRHVLAQFRERPAKTPEKNNNNDILWTIDAGKGRVFHCGLGHDVKAWSNPSFQKLILQGIHWAAGNPRTVTFPAGK